jgi:hypothetical protein
MADTDKPEIQPNKGVFALVLIAGVVVFAFLFNLYGFLKLPTGTAQEIAAYYGTRLIPLGIALTLLGFAAAIATTAGTAFGKVVGGEFKAQGVGFDVPQVTDLLKAAAGLSSTPAGIGVLVTILGVALLVGSGAAAAATPPQTT